MEKDYTTIQRFEDLQGVFDEHLLWADRQVIRLVTAAVIGNQLDADPVWILVVAASSGGKTEIISSLNDIKIGGNQTIWPISDLTRNAFVSGMRGSGGKETSLLFQIPYGGIMTFKDFTSILSKNRDDQQEIMGQLREIYDGEYEKRVGTGDELKWKGKIGAIAGSTGVIYEHLERMSAMGDRFMMYNMKQPPRKDVARLIFANQDAGISKTTMRDKNKAAMSAYVNYIVKNMKEEHVKLSPVMREEILMVADFCTAVRSGVITDERKGHIKFVPEQEMPMRMMEQLLSLSNAFIAMDATEPQGNKNAEKGIIKPDDLKLLYKVAFDSIPIKRRMALQLLTRHKGGITTAGLATAVGYQTPVVGQWLAELNALGVCDREKSAGPQGDLWILKDQARAVMTRFHDIKVEDDQLRDDKADSEAKDDEESWLSGAMHEMDGIDSEAADSFG